MGLIQKLTGSKVNRNFHIYLILMLVIYTAYVLLMNYRIKMSDVWMAKADTLTPENIESIMQYGKWSERIEISSIILFVVMGILSIITNKLWVFFKYNLILVISILMFSFVFYFITTLTIFNLLLPLMNLSSYFSILLVYVLLAKILKFRRDKKIMLLVDYETVGLAVFLRSSKVMVMASLKRLFPIVELFVIISVILH